MKRIISVLFSCFAVLSLLASCGNDNEPRIAGTYASFQSGEYSLSNDTLIIMSYGDADSYQVIRKSGFQAVRGGKLQPKELKIREYIGHFDPKTRTLVIDAQGRKISFFPGKKSLLLMQREYQKVIKK